MASWGRALLLMTTMVLPGLLAGCVKAIDDEPERPARWACFSEPIDVDAGCGGPTCFCSEPPSCDDCCDARCTIGEVPLSPPLLGPMVERVRIACEGCDGVAITSDGTSVFVGSPIGLMVVGPYDTRYVPRPEPTLIGGTAVPLRSVALAHDGVDLWFGALADAPGATQLVLARWNGEQGWYAEDPTPLDLAPTLARAERLHLVAVTGGLVIVLEAQGRAWVMRADAPQAASGLPLPLTPPEARVVLGAPARDEEGRAYVPYVEWGPTGGTPSRRYATLGHIDGPWTHGEGPMAPGGVWDGSSPAMAVDGTGWTYAWTGADGRASTSRSRDGVAWDEPAFWSEAGALAAGLSVHAADDVTTLAWIEDGAARLARQRGAEPQATADVSGAASAPGLAVMPPLRAVVAWLEEASLVVAVEGSEKSGDGCDDAAHCAPRRGWLAA